VIGAAILADENDDVLDRRFRMDAPLRFVIVVVITTIVLRVVRQAGCGGRERDRQRCRTDGPLASITTRVPHKSSLELDWF
jgi:hypothetical protein